MTPARSLAVAMLALAVLIGARPGAEAQFPRGLMAAAPKDKPAGFCTIETRPLSFGTYDPLATGTLDALAEVIYACNSQARNIRIEISTGYSQQFDRSMSSGTAVDFLQYNVYLDATRRTVWGNGTNGTDVYFESNPANGTPVVVPVYGRIAARQDVPAGEYRDVLNVVVLF